MVKVEEHNLPESPSLHLALFFVRSPMYIHTYIHTAELQCWPSRSVHMDMVPIVVGMFNI